jgi:hypothetical protein
MGNGHGSLGKREAHFGKQRRNQRQWKTLRFRKNWALNAEGERNELEWDYIDNKERVRNKYVTVLLTSTPSKRTVEWGGGLNSELYIQRYIQMIGRLRLQRDGTHRQRRQFSRLLAAEVCASAVVMLDTPCSEVVSPSLPSRASPSAITFQLDTNIHAPATLTLDWRLGG